MPDLNTRLGTKLITKSRLETLYYFVYEMSQSFGVDGDALDSITKGILNRKILKQVTINYKDKDDVIVGRVLIKIDWEKHELLASTDYGASFTLDPNKSVRSQMSEISGTIVEHVTNMRKALQIKTIGTTYRYISENDDAQYKEDMKYMGHVFGSNEKVSITKDFTNSIEWLCDKLKEVKITVEHS